MVFIEYFLCARHFCKHFINIYSFNLHKNIESVVMRIKWVNIYQLYFIGEETERQMVECQDHPAGKL